MFHHVNSILSYMYTAWLSRKPPYSLPTSFPKPQKINETFEAKLHSDFHLMSHKAALPNSLQHWRNTNKFQISCYHLGDLHYLINILMNMFNLILWHYQLSHPIPYVQEYRASVVTADHALGKDSKLKTVRFHPDTWEKSLPGTHLLTHCWHCEYH